MGRYDFRPSRVRQTVSMLVSAGRMRHEPPWYKAITDFPPSETIVRTQPVQHEYTHQPGSFSAPRPFPSHKSHVASSRGHRRTRKPSKMYAPQQIEYEEDELRSDFFSDHPWELARPRQLLEDDGKDYQKWDWSKSYEPGRPVSGESVILRQLHLTHGSGLSKAAAYDQARKEFYEARHLTEVERRVAREEAEALGASFGATAGSVGMKLENETFERWKKWAEEQVVYIEQTKSSAYGGSALAEDGAGDTSAEPEPASPLEAGIERL